MWKELVGGMYVELKSQRVVEFVETHPFDSAQGRLLPQRQGWKRCTRHTRQNGTTERRALPDLARSGVPQSLMYSFRRDWKSRPFKATTRDMAQKAYLGR
jgi:hypothetical protein